MAKCVRSHQTYFVLFKTKAYHIMILNRKKGISVYATARVGGYLNLMMRISYLGFDQEKSF